MLTQEQIDDIEYKAVEDYMYEIRNRPNTYYSDEELRGDIQHWTDADDYYTVPGECIVDKETIREWILDYFETIIEEFSHKHKKGSRYLSELATASDIVDEETFYDFIYEKCGEAEDYFEESDIYEELCNDYFSEYGKEIEPEW